MAATQGVLNHPLTAGPTLTAAGRSPMAASPADSSNDSSSAASAGISANDFLTLLVTELKNQDPTANTDPNQYINQLVSVNSLEQLININQTLTTGLGGAATKPKASLATVPSASSPPGLSGRSASTLVQPASVPLSSSTAPSAASAKASGQAAARVATGNLSVPPTSSAANSVAHALDGRSQAESRAGGLLGVR